MRIHTRSRLRANTALPTREQRAATAPSPSVPSTIAGYAVVRRLSEGRRSDIYLGHSAANRVSQVALKVFRTAAPADSVEREITALGEARSGLVNLIDVATLADGRICLVLERLKGKSLAHYLARLAPLSAGEAVTILAPVVVALRDLHGAGLVHTGLSQASVVIDERGRPVVLGLGSLESLPAHGAERIVLLRADYGRLAVLATGVLGQVVENQPRSAARAALIERCEAAARATTFVECLPQIERLLFDWAPATALTFVRAARDDNAGDDEDSPRILARGRWTPADAPSQTEAVKDDDGTDGESEDDFRAGTTKIAPHGLDERIDIGALRLGLRVGWAADSAELLRALARLGQHLRIRVLALVPRLRPKVSGAVDLPVARRWSLVVYAASLASAATITVLVLLPAAAPDGPPGSSIPFESASGLPAPAVPGAAANDVTVLAADEPLAAVRVLLQLRAQCLAAASVACLTTTDQPGGPLMTADTQSIATSATGSAFTLGSGGTAELIERTGNSALVALIVQMKPGPAGDEQSQPASALVIKGESGWRMRELFYY